MKVVARTSRQHPIYVRRDAEGKRVYWSDVNEFEWHTGRTDIEMLKTVLRLEQEALCADWLFRSGEGDRS